MCACYHRYRRLVQSCAELFLMVCLQAGVVIMLLGRWYSKVTPKQEEKDDGSHDNNAPDVEADMAEFVRM